MLKKSSHKHFAAAAVLAFGGLLALFTPYPLTAAFLFDYSLVFLLVGGLHRGLETL